MVAGFLEVADEAALYEQLLRTTRDLGFSQFAMGHHVDLVRPPAGAIRLTNYDPFWVERSLAERYFIDDPIHQASTRIARGFLWSEAHGLIRMTARQHLILETASDHGLRQGYTVPVNVTGEYRGTCSFGAKDLENLAPDGLLIAQLVGINAFEAARQLVRRRHQLPNEFQEVPVLTGRQHDSLVLVARGKGDTEIGALLGISKATAHEHVENVRKAYGYAQRTFLIARAIFDGQISWIEIFGR
jgi:LuxR family quorum-sensing system transcriptional regulator CciR